MAGLHRSGPSASPGERAGAIGLRGRVVSGNSDDHGMRGGATGFRKAGHVLGSDMVSSVEHLLAPRTLSDQNPGGVGWLGVSGSDNVDA